MRSFVPLLLAAGLAAPAAAASIQKARERVVSATLDYLAVPYLWGGEHPRIGLDCSGFTQLVFERAGLDLPRISRDQFRFGRKVRPEEVRPGDLVFFAMKHPGTARVDHVGIYVGRGYFVHASYSNGVHIDPIAKPYYWERLVAVRKHPGFGR